MPILRRQAPHIELRIHLSIQRSCIVGREAEVLGCEGQLVDEMSDIRVIQVHEFVHVCEVEEAAWSGRLWCRL
jgi:hypothetical protein